VRQLILLLSLVLASVLVPAGCILAQTPKMRLFGVVLDHSSGKPIEGVAIRLEGTEVRTVTDARGRFEIASLSPGQHRLRVDRLGYETRTIEVASEPGRDLEATIRLSTKPVELPAVAVVARSTWLAEAGYYDRRDTGGHTGVFIDRAEIERRQPDTLTDLLEDLTSVNVIYMEPGKRTVRFNRYTSMSSSSRNRGAIDRSRNPLDQRGCEPDLYIDGHRYRNASGPIRTDGRTTVWEEPLNKVDDFNAVAIIAVEAMEVFVGSRTPSQYNSPCGVILVWTRRGR
jgi:hypothetical protein